MIHMHLQGRQSLQLEIFLTYIAVSSRIQVEVNRYIGGGGGERPDTNRDAGNKDENIAGFIAVLIIKSIKYGPAKRNGKNS